MNDVTEAEQDNLVCPHCIEPIGRFDHFCPHCSKPVTTHASIDPMGQVYSAGQAYQNATEKPRLMVVVGMWLIFGPQVPLLIFDLFASLSSLFRPNHTYSVGDGSSMTIISDGIVPDLVKLLVVIGLLALYGLILRKVTMRYLVARRAARPENEEPLNEDNSM